MHLYSINGKMPHSFRHPQRPLVASGISYDRGRCPDGRSGLGMTERSSLVWRGVFFWVMASGLLFNMGSVAFAKANFFQEDRLSAMQSIEVRRVKDGAVVYATDPDVPLMPGSTLKVLTAGAVLEGLGAFRTLETRFLHTGIRTGDTIAGDLVIVGDGDPLFTSESMWQVARDLYNQGIRRITGNVIIDNQMIPVQKREEALQKKGTHSAYDAPLSAFIMNFNTYSVLVAPSLTLGQSAKVQLDPYPLEGVTIENQIKTGSAKSTKKVEIFRHGQGAAEKLSATGTVPLGMEAVKFWRAAEDPVQAAGAYVKAFLAHEGIVVQGKGLAGLHTSSSKSLVKWKSQPVSTLVRSMLLFSNNVLTDVLAQRWVAEKMGTSTPTSAVQSLEAYVQTKGPFTSSLTLRDGSGLDRGNAISAHTMVQFLLTMARDELVFPDYLSLFAAAGGAGGLHNRFQGNGREDFASRIRAKTGTLAQSPCVAALVGYFFHPKQGWLAFAILQNAKSGKTEPTLDQLHQAQEAGLYQIYKQEQGT